MSSALKKFWPAILLGGLVVITLYPIWFGNFYATGDMRDVTIPIESFFQQQERLGHLPSWMPNAAFGFPIIAAAQIGFFYPPLLIGRLLPLNIYLPLMLILHIYGCAVGTYLFARKIGQSQLAAMLSAVGFASGAFLWQHITHLNIFLVVAWLPWQLVMARSLATSAKQKWQLIGTFALCLGIPFLIGQLQIPTLIAVISLLYYGIMASNMKGNWGSILKIGLLVAVLAAAIASVQILPTLELVNHSSRGSSGDFDIVRANQHSYPLYHLPTMVFPRFFGQDNTYWGKRLEIEYGFFIGTAPLLLALVASWQILKHKSSNREQLFFVFMAGLTFLLGLGSLSPFRLIGLEPSLWVFSAPARWLLFTSFSLAILAGWSVDNLSPKTILRNKWLLAICWGTVILATYMLTNKALIAWLLTAVQNITHLSSPTQVDKLSQLAGYAKETSISLFSPYTWLPLLGLSIISFTPKTYIKRVVVIVSLIELTIIAATTSPTVSWKDILEPPATLKELPPAVQSGQARLLVIQPTGADTGAWFTDPQSRADAKIRQQQKDLLVPLLGAQFNIPGIAWPASLDIQSIAEATSSIDITDTKALADLNIGAMSQIKEGVVTITPTKHEPRMSLLDTATLIEKDIEYQPVTPTYLTQEIEAAHDSRLVIRDTWYPGWNAYLNNRSIRVQKIGPHNIFRAITIPAGQHTLEIKYEPTPLYIGLAITVFGILLSCALVGIGYKL